MRRQVSITVTRLLLLWLGAVLMSPAGSAAASRQLDTVVYQAVDAVEQEVAVDLALAVGTTEPAGPGYATDSAPNQPTPDQNFREHRLSWFFLIGMIVNVVMMVAFLTWALKQWKRTDT